MHSLTSFEPKQLAKSNNPLYKYKKKRRRKNTNLTTIYSQRSVTIYSKPLYMIASATNLELDRYYPIYSKQRSYTVYTADTKMTLVFLQTTITVKYPRPFKIIYIIHIYRLPRVPMLLQLVD